MVKIGIIGGSGLDDPRLLKEAKEKQVTTIYGEPSSPLTTGKLDDVDTVIIARHGRGHTIPPTQINNRANILALKNEGCTHILATTACGSLREEIKRGDIVILDQFIDFTRLRKLTFYEEFEYGAENAKHTPMADPFNEELRHKLIASSEELGLSFHKKGTVITIEGPRFSTRAESQMYRIWGADVVNMSVAPEAILSNELGIPYAAVAMSTDYDAWKVDENPVEWTEVLETFNKNVENVKQLLLKTIGSMK